MAFYKIIQNGNVVGVGSSFLEWNNTFHQMFITDVNHGQFVMSNIDERKFRDDWLKPYPKEASGYEKAVITMIEESEYDDIYQLLTEGETVSEKEEFIEELPLDNNEEEPITPEEKPLTLAEMRKLILLQQKQIDELLKKTD